MSRGKGWAEAAEGGTRRSAYLRATLDEMVPPPAGKVHVARRHRTTPRGGQLTAHLSWCVCGSPSSPANDRCLWGVMFELACVLGSRVLSVMGLEEGERLVEARVAAMLMMREVESG